MNVGKKHLVSDEAALCQNCEVRVHKLAAKHHRFTLERNHPEFKEFPLCDFCQGKRGLLFCKEDRALLCKECDLPIHRADQHTKKHSRFLLTRGPEISAADFESGQIATCTSNDTDSRLDLNSISCDYGYENESIQPFSQQGSVSTSSILEYLMKTRPGWHFEDLLDDTLLLLVTICDQMSKDYRQKNGEAIFHYYADRIY